MHCNKECEHINCCCINRIETDILNLMSEHSVTETMYNDILEHIEIDIPLNSCLDQWQEYVTAHGMSFDDFIANTVMAVISELCSDVTIKEKHKYMHTSDSKIHSRKKQIINSRKNCYGQESQDLIKDTPARRLSSLYTAEFLLVLHEEMIGDYVDDITSNPLLKLALSKNIRLQHFHTEDLQELIDYYKSICSFLESHKLGEFEKIMIMYHLDIELRFLTIFKFLRICGNNNISKVMFDIARGLSRNSKYVLRNGESCVYSFQNLVYYGIDPYIQQIAYCCVNNLYDECVSMIRKLYNIVQPMYTLRDTIVNKMKSSYNYKDCVNEMYFSLNEILGQLKNKKSVGFYFNDNSEEPFHMVCLKMIHQYDKDYIKYSSLMTYDITLDHFVRMYISDDKYGSLTRTVNKKREARRQRGKKAKETKN